MIKLKLAVLATTAVGAVTAGGIAYATVGSSTPSAPAKVKAVKDAAGNAAREATSKVPAVPTCVPSAPAAKLPKAKAPKAKLPKAKNHVIKNHHIVKGHLPATPSLPVTPPAGVPTSVPGGLPTTAPSGLPKPAGVPTCLPSVPKPGDRTTQGTAQTGPALPKAPEGKQPSCDKVPPAITSKKTMAKDLALPNGMHLAYAHAHSVTVQSRTVCGNVEKFVGMAGSFLTVERVQTPPQVTLQQMATALKMPQGKVVSVGGTQAWETPLGTGMVWFSDQGYAIAITGSPSLATQLPTIATRLQHLK